MENITFTIKTFLRKTSIKSLLLSIEKYYPKAKVIVLDDSPLPLLRATFLKKLDLNIHYIRTRFYIGSGKGRNIILDNIKTKYFIYLDDDFCFKRKVHFVNMIALFEKYNCDIIGGDTIDHKGSKISKRIFHGNFTKVNDQLFCHQSSNLNTPEICDYTLNFFLAKTNAVKKIRWNDALKTLEHIDFFYRGKSKQIIVLHNPNLLIDHIIDKSKHKVYNFFRLRNATIKYSSVLKKSLGVTKVFFDEKEVIG